MFHFWRNISRLGFSYFSFFTLAILTAWGNSACSLIDFSVPPDNSFPIIEPDRDHVSLFLESGTVVPMISPLFKEKRFYPVFPDGIVLQSPFSFEGSSYDCIFALASSLGLSVRSAGRFLICSSSDSDSESSSFILPLNALTASFLSSSDVSVSASASDFPVSGFSRVGNAVRFTGSLVELSDLLSFPPVFYRVSLISFVTDFSTASKLSAVVEPSQIAEFFATGGGNFWKFLLSDVKYVLDFSAVQSESLKEDSFIASGEINISRGVRDPYSTSSVSEGVIVQSAVSFIDTLTKYSGFITSDYLSLSVSDSVADSYSDDGYPVQHSVSFHADFPFEVGKYYRVYSYSVKSRSVGFLDFFSLSGSSQDLIRLYFVHIDPF